MTDSFDKTTLSHYFSLCVQGYHMLNTDPIKEAVWESINALVFKYSGIPAWYRKMYANADSRFSDFARDMLLGLQKSPIYQALAAVELDPELLEQSGNNSIKSEIGWKRTDDAFIIEASGLYVGETMFVCRTLANIFRRSRPQ